MKNKCCLILLILFINTCFSQTKKLLIIGIDGCRADVITKEFAPTMDSIIYAKNTAYTYEMKNENHTMSAANWSSMLTGVHWNKHHAKNNSKFKKGDFKKYPHIFKRIKESNPNLKTASFPSWMEINKYIAKENVDDAQIFAKDVNDSLVQQKALTWLNVINDSTPDAMFIHFDNVDHNGHATGFSAGNKNYTNAVIQKDKYVNELTQLVNKRKEKYNEDWLLIISTDHGGRKHKKIGGHAIGIFNKHIRKVFLIMNGDDVQPGKIANAHTVDIGVTAMEFFKVPIKKEWKLQGKKVGLK